jgi:hypothetical protein
MLKRSHANGVIMEDVMAEPIAPGERSHRLVAGAIREFKRLLVMVLYLWVVFGLYVLDETIILAKQHVSFSSQGFAIINAIVLAKVLLVAEDVNFANRFKDAPLIYPILYKAGFWRRGARLAFALSSQSLPDDDRSRV